MVELFTLCIALDGGEGLVLLALHRVRITLPVEQAEVAVASLLGVSLI